MPEELFDILDENGKVVGQKPRGEVHAKGLRHKGIYLMLFDGKGRVFLQQRAGNKDLMPLRRDFSCAEHLQVGESYENACIRGAAEELSIKVRNLRFVGKKPSDSKAKMNKKTGK